MLLQNQLYVIPCRMSKLPSITSPESENRAICRDQNCSAVVTQHELQNQCALETSMTAACTHPHDLLPRPLPLHYLATVSELRTTNTLTVSTLSISLI